MLIRIGKHTASLLIVQYIDLFIYTRAAVRETTDPLVLDCELTTSMNGRFPCSHSLLPPYKPVANRLIVTDTEGETVGE